MGLVWKPRRRGLGGPVQTSPGPVGCALGPGAGRLLSPCTRPPPGWAPAVAARLVTVLLSLQAQLIHDRNTTSHSAVAARTQAPCTLDKVQMTWTKEKLVAEKYTGTRTPACLGSRTSSA